MPLYELGTAFFCSSIISPVMMVMDTAIIKSQFEKIPIQKSYQDTFNGYWKGHLRWQKPFRIMNSVYFSTYATANLTELYCSHHSPENRWLTFFLTSFVNIVGITYKDRSYIKMFEHQVLDIPYRSYALFALRDSFTIGSTFVLKKDLVQYLHHDYCVSYPLADFVSSFSLPILAQLFSTPLHILSMDYYQRPQARMADRIEHIYRLYPSICTGRMLRVLPAFCFGSFLNDILRSGRIFRDE